MKARISEEIEEKYWKNTVNGRRNKSALGQIDELCTQYFQMPFHDIVLLRPQELQEFVEDLSHDERREKIKKDFQSVASNYIVNTLYARLKEDNKKIIFNLTADKVCPYCNRTYIEYVKRDKLHVTYELDHYYNKDAYPFLAVSLYNLIPVCPSCNRIKGTKKFLYYPYDDKNSYGDSRFGYEIKGTDFLTNSDDFEITIEYFNKALETADNELYMKELYQTHKDVAQEIIRKCQYFGKGYAKSLMTAFPGGLFQNESEIYRLVFENYLDEEDFGKRPLSKMTRDIADETLSILGIEHEWG